MDAEQEQAASRMAAAQRGRQARKEAVEQKNAASKVAAAQRGKHVRKQRKQENDAATAVQARVRGKSERAKAKGAGQRYFTPNEIALHNRADDLWVSIFHKVYDLTKLVADNDGRLVQPIIEAAGTDITHWFDSITKEVKTHIDPITELEAPFCPMGEFLHCAPTMPTGDWSSNIGNPWWKDRSLQIGALSMKTRKIRLFNMLTQQENIIEVCSEETLEEIQRRYLAFNQHAASYTWKRSDDSELARSLDMRKTLHENGISDEDLQFDLLSLDPDEHVPTIHLYFSGARMRNDA